MKKRTKILGIALALAAILTLAIGTAVFADAPGTGVTQEYCGGIGWHGNNGNGGFCSDAVSELLGLTYKLMCNYLGVHILHNLATPF